MIYIITDSSPIYLLWAFDLPSQSYNFIFMCRDITNLNVFSLGFEGASNVMPSYQQSLTVIDRLPCSFHDDW